jgi:hypothetical protein
MRIAGGPRPDRARGGEQFHQNDMYFKKSKPHAKNSYFGEGHDDTASALTAPKDQQRGLGRTGAGNVCRAFLPSPSVRRSIEAQKTTPASANQPAQGTAG